MGVFLRTFRTPRQADCVSCLEKSKNELKGRTWKDVKNYVYNTNNSAKKRLKRLAKN